MIVSAKITGVNVAYADYSKQPAGVKRGSPDWVMTRSELMAFAACPEKWIASEDTDTDTPATIWGRLVECLEMSPENFGSLFVVHPETYPPAGKPWTRRANYCSDWEEERTSAGLTVISPKVRAEADIALYALRSYLPRVDLVACSKKQVMVEGSFSVGAQTIPLRCLLDLVPNKTHLNFGRWLADSKTARNGDPKAFERVIDDEAYDVQAALGMDLYKKATGEDRTDWVFPLQENIKPYHVVKPMPALTAEFIAWGRDKYVAALGYYSRCLDSGQWPSYPVRGFVMGNAQYLSPAELWSYKQGGVTGAMPQDYEPPPPERDDQEVTP